MTSQPFYLVLFAQRKQCCNVDITYSKILKVEAGRCVVIWGQQRRMQVVNVQRFKDMSESDIKELMTILK